MSNRLTKDLKSIYNEVVATKIPEPGFWILCSFIPTFMIARLIVRNYPNLFLQVGQHHIHHFTYGIVLLAISGYVSIIIKGRTPIWVAIIYGIGLALAVDETGMWLHLTNYYYSDTSEDTIVFVIVALIILIYFRDLWKKLLRLVSKKVR